MNRGTAAKARARGFKANVAGKTGTSRDGWFAGYTPELVCVVYVGFDDGSQLGMTGGDSALPIWADFMTAALRRTPNGRATGRCPAASNRSRLTLRPAGCRRKTRLSKRTELFIGGTAPTAPSEEPTDDTEMTDGTTTGEGEGVAPLPTPDALMGSPLPEASPPTRPRVGSNANTGDAAPEDSTRLTGAVTLDIDPTTGFIAVETCPVIRTKTFAIGAEPRRRCGPQYHTGRDILPSETRPRRVSP